MKYWPEKILNIALLGASIWFIGAFIYIASSTLAYPFNLEWMEGHSIDVIARIIRGEPVFNEPSLEYVALIYTPYYFYVSAFVSLFTGVDFLPARIVSFLSALGIGVFLYLWTRKEGGKAIHGVLAAGLFYATYALSGRWLDIARVDSLFLLLTLAGLYVFLYYRDFQNQLFAAVLLILAFYTKQSALMIAFPIFAAGLILYPRHTLITGIMLTLMLVISLGIYHIATDGWSTFFILEVPAGHDNDNAMYLGFWWGDLLPNLAPFLLLILCLIFNETRKDWRKGLFYAALAVGFIGAAYLSRLHRYGWINVLIPAHIIFALLTAIYYARIHNYWVRIIVSLVILFQFYSLIYEPVKYIPKQESIDVGNKFLEELVKYPGEVLIADLQFVQTRVGKKSFAYGMAGVDVMRARLKTKTYIKGKLRREIADAIKSQRFGAVTTTRVLRLPELHQYYVFDRKLDYPREYVSGAINFMQGNMYVPLDKSTVSKDDSSPIE